MKNNVFVKLLIVLLVFSCNSYKEREAEDIGRLKQEIIELESENVQLQKDMVKKHIVREGKRFFYIQTYILILIINNALWFILYRRIVR